MPRQGKASRRNNDILYYTPRDPLYTTADYAPTCFSDWNVSTQPITKSIGPLLFNQEKKKKKKKKKREFERGERKTLAHKMKSPVCIIRSQRLARGAKRPTTHR
jgi:hypothetical protein